VNQHHVYIVGQHEQGSGYGRLASVTAGNDHDFCSAFLFCEKRTNRIDLCFRGRNHNKINNSGRSQAVNRMNEHRSSTNSAQGFGYPSTQTLTAPGGWYQGRSAP
jgi:hypothetical protein